MAASLKYSVTSLIAGVLVSAAIGSAEAQVAASNVNFTDPAHALTPAATASAVVAPSSGSSRFASLATPPDTTTPAAQTDEPRRLELELSAPGSVTGMPVDVSIAQRASLGADRGGDINHRGTGSEVRIGHALGNLVHSDRPQGTHRIYAFVASDNDALTWQPGGGGVALQQDRVEVGDHQAGVTYERGNVQASLAYVERSVSAHVGHESYSKDQNFTGVTLTMRH